MKREIIAAVLLATMIACEDDKPAPGSSTANTVSAKNPTASSAVGSSSLLSGLTFEPRTGTVCLADPPSCSTPVESSSGSFVVDLSQSDDLSEASYQIVNNQLSNLTFHKKDGSSFRIKVSFDTSVNSYFFWNDSNDPKPITLLNFDPATGLYKKGREQPSTSVSVTPPPPAAPAQPDLWFVPATNELCYHEAAGDLCEKTDLTCKADSAKKSYACEKTTPTFSLYMEFHLDPATSLYLPCWECKRPAQDRCGNGICEAGEDELNCPSCPDPRKVCPLGVCTMKCEKDCVRLPPPAPRNACGNGVCDPGESEMLCPPCPDPNRPCPASPCLMRCERDCPPRAALTPPNEIPE